MKSRENTQIINLNLLLEKKGYLGCWWKIDSATLVNSDLWVTTRARDHYSCLICELSFLLLVLFDVLHFMGYNLIQWIFVCETWMCMRLDSTYLDQESWLADLKCQGDFSSTYYHIAIDLLNKEIISKAFSPFIIYTSYLLFIFFLLLIWSVFSFFFIALQPLWWEQQWVTLIIGCHFVFSF